jgi:hypothetical protein
MEQQFNELLLQHMRDCVEGSKQVQIHLQSIDNVLLAGQKELYRYLIGAIMALVGGSLWLLTHGVPYLSAEQTEAQLHALQDRVHTLEQQHHR